MSGISTGLRRATDVAGDRWVLLTLAALANGPRRFGDLITELAGGVTDRGGGAGAGIAPNVLTDRLRRMERDGIVNATPYSDRPRRYVYDLTESGRELASVLAGLATWAARRSGGEAVVHDVCGTALETRVWCPNCESTVADDLPIRTESEPRLRWL